MGALGRIVHKFHIVEYIDKLNDKYSFHENMKGTIQHNGSSSDPFPIKSGVKQGCVLAPTLFGILFSLLLRYA